jgi:hypothetical protein
VLVSGRRRSVGRRRGYKLTNAEAAKCKFNEPCPSCRSQRTWEAGTSVGGNKGCHECGKERGWFDARGSSISRAEYQERVENAAAKWQADSAQSWALDAPGEGSDMAKKKKKAAKKKLAGKKPVARRVAKKGAQKARDPRIPKVGTVLKTKYKGKEHTAKVTADGFEFKGKTYGSISKVGSLIMGGKACNGYKMFGLC